MNAWKVRLRDEKGREHTLELVAGADTTIRQLKQLVNKASKVPQYKQVWKAGFPPKVVFSPLTELANTAHISTVLANRDLVTLEAASAAELQAAIDKADADEDPDAAATANTTNDAALEARPAQLETAPPTQAGSADGAAKRTAPERKSRRAAPDAEAEAPCTSAAAQPRDGPAAPAPAQTSPVAAAAALRTQGAAAGTYAQQPASAAHPSGGQKAKRRKKGSFAGAAHLLTDEAAPAPKDEVSAMRQAEDGVLGALLQAARGGSKMGDLLGQDWTPGNKSLFKALRGDLRDARAARDHEAAASVKVSAARAGQVQFRDLTDGTGRMEAVWQHGKDTRRECVPHISPFLLAAVLISLYHDADAVVAQNLSPFAMAQVSPRTFWALVRHGGVSAQVTFEEALCKVVPNLDWGKLRVDVRQRKQPVKLAM